MIPQKYLDLACYQHLADFGRPPAEIASLQS
jgi:hypothetical protein